MGMFDSVFFAAKCPVCGRENSDWQTKDSKDGDLMLRLLQVSDIEVGGTFYTDCGSCGVWIEYEVGKDGAPSLIMPEPPPSEDRT